MVDVTVDIQVYCNKCGAGICRNVTVDGNEFHVDPCEDCLNEAATDGHTEGYNERNHEAETEKE